VALHSIAIGIVLIVAGDWGATFGGWPPARPAFFLRQFAVFHFAIAAAYLIEFFRYGGVATIIAAKAIAVISLMGTLAIDHGPWAVGASALADAMMAVAVGWLASRGPTIDDAS